MDYTECMKNLDVKDNALFKEYSTLCDTFKSYDPAQTWTAERAECYEEYIILRREYRECMADIRDIFNKYLNYYVLNKPDAEAPTEEEYNKCMSYDLHDKCEEIMEKSKLV